VTLSIIQHTIINNTPLHKAIANKNNWIEDVPPIIRKIPLHKVFG
jgi:hypothetical protein